MRFVLFIAIIFSNAAPAAPDAALLDAVARSLVKVRAVKDSSRRLATGTAVVIAPGMLITSCHGTRDSRAIDVLGANKAWQVTQQWKDMEHDLCLLQTDAQVAPPLPLANGAQTRVGDSVAAVGFAGPTLRQSTGSVRALHAHDGGYVIQTDATFHGGESGGALVNANGELIGVLTFFAYGKREYFFAVPVDWVRALQDQAAGKTVVPSQPELSFWERTGAEQPPFLRAAALEYNQDWSALREAAAQWTRLEARNPEAWIALGKAHHFSQQGHAAVEALQQALALEPRHPTGLLYLGAAYRELDDAEGVRQVLERLDRLSPQAAEALRQGTSSDW